MVGLLSLICISTLIWQDAQSKQFIKELAGIAQPLKAVEDSFYQDRVAVIFDKYCVACHGENKAKGHLRMDSFRHTVFGGKSGDMLSGGDNSLLIQRMSLPDEARLAMPPYGRDRQTSDEMKVIQMWLSKGASGTLPEQAFPDAPSKPKVIEFVEVDKQEIKNARSPLAQHVHQLQKHYPYTLAYVARTSAFLSLETNFLTKFTDQDLVAFEVVADKLVQLDLSNSQITGKAIDSVLKMKNVQQLVLTNTRLSAESLGRLTQLTELQRLVVSDIPGIESLLNDLQQLGTKVVKVKQGHQKNG